MTKERRFHPTEPENQQRTYYAQPCPAPSAGHRVYQRNMQPCPAHSAAHRVYIPQGTVPAALRARGVRTNPTQYIGPRPIPVRVVIWIIHSRG